MLGVVDRERQTPLAEDSIFRIYSMTKPITSVAIMMLVEECKIALDDPVSKYIPSWENLGVCAGGYTDSFQTRPAKRQMLVVDLLRHTSGLTYGFQQNSQCRCRLPQAEDCRPDHRAARRWTTWSGSCRSCRWSSRPARPWNYSVSTDVLGYLVGKVSGMPFESFVKQRILDPLGMVDTAFHVPEDKVSRFCACYAVGVLWLESVSQDRPTLQDDPPHQPVPEAAHACFRRRRAASSTAADYLRFSACCCKAGNSMGCACSAPRRWR